MNMTWRVRTGLAGSLPPPWSDDQGWVMARARAPQRVTTVATAD